jgi:hypothetical protein
MEKIESRLEELGLELLCRLPYDEKLEQMVFENSSIVSIDGLDIRSSITTIVDSVRRM